MIRDSPHTTHADSARSVRADFNEFDDLMNVARMFTCTFILSNACAMCLIKVKVDYDLVFNKLRLSIYFDCLMATELYHDIDSTF